MIVETERLIIRSFTEDDADFVLDLLNQPSFLEHIGDKGVRTIEDARAYLRSGPLESYTRNGFGLYLVALKESGTPVGMCGLVRRASLPDPDLGYAFLPAWWSKGFAIESARAVLAWARGSIGPGRILAITSPANGDSIRLLEKLGFRFEGMIRLPHEEADTSLFSYDADAAPVQPGPGQTRGAGQTAS
jgi:RimJ/RimL family protein N-acetyltransferase